MLHIFLSNGKSILLTQRYAKLMEITFKFKDKTYVA